MWADPGIWDRVGGVENESGVSRSRNPAVREELGVDVRRGDGLLRAMVGEADRRRMRRRVLMEWRRVHEPRDTSRFMRSTGDLVPTVMKRLGVAERFQEERIAGVWSEIVGAFLAAQSRPVKIERRVLTVAVLQPAVLYTLDRDLKPQITRRLRERFGENVVSSVRFMHG